MKPLALAFLLLFPLAGLLLSGFRGWLDVVGLVTE